MALAPDIDTIEALLRRARNGDEAAEGKIFRRLFVRFRYLAARRVGDEQAAEDIAQAACVTVLQKYKAQSFSVEFGAWAYGVLRVLLRKHFAALSKDRGRIQGEAETVPVAAEEIDPEMERRLVNCLHKVAGSNRRYARALNLTYQGYSAREIADRLDVNRNHLYVILNRARSMLWQCLQGAES